ncbi:MAG: hypothetical protein JWN09_2152 [Microbacteriaceae bacterium]|jgi:hypothetical protein|nr:hypothetical protein [Microbacteriaceae bacterium]
MYYAYQPDAGQTTTSTVGSIILYIIMVIGLWRIFSKAGRPGWLAIIPIVNLIVLIQVSGHSGWLVLLYIIPIVNIVVSIVVAVHLAKSFGKGGAFGFFLLWLLSIIGYLILAFGSSTHHDRRQLQA